MIAGFALRLHGMLFDFMTFPCMKQPRGASPAAALITFSLMVRDDYAIERDFGATRESLC